MTDGQHAQSVLVVELEAWILSPGLIPESPDAEISHVLHDIVEDDHAPIAQLGSPCLVIVADSLVGVIAIDVQQIDLTVLKPLCGLVKGHLQQTGKGAIARVVVSPQFLKNLGADNPVMRVPLPGVDGKGACWQAKPLDGLAEPAV